VKKSCEDASARDERSWRIHSRQFPFSSLSTGSDDVTYFGLGFLFYHWTLYPVFLFLSFVSDSRAEREKRETHIFQQIFFRLLNEGSPLSGERVGGVAPFHHEFSGFYHLSLFFSLSAVEKIYKTDRHALKKMCLFSCVWICRDEFLRLSINNTFHITRYTGADVDDDDEVRPRAPLQHLSIGLELLAARRNSRETTAGETNSIHQARSRV
jgi:hypothetical protein